MLCSAHGNPIYCGECYEALKNIPPRNPNATPGVEVNQAHGHVAHERPLPASQGDTREASTGQGGESVAELGGAAESGEEPAGGRWVVGSVLRFASVRVNSTDRLDVRGLGKRVALALALRPFGRLFLDGIREQMRWSHEAVPSSSLSVDGLGAPPVAAGGSSASDGALELGAKSSATFSGVRSCARHTNCDDADARAVATIDGASGAEHE